MKQHREKQSRQFAVKCRGFVGDGSSSTMEDGEPSSPEGFRGSPEGHLRSPEEVSDDFTTQLNNSRLYSPEDYDTTEGEEFKVRYFFSFPYLGIRQNFQHVCTNAITRNGNRIVVSVLVLLKIYTMTKFGQ